MAADADEVAVYLEDVKNRLATDHSHAVTGEHIVHQNVAQAIIDQSSAQPSLVAMTTHGRGGVGRMVLGSVTDRVVRHANVPILVMR